MRRTSDPQVERIDALFVQSATAFSSGPGTITLHGLADSTVYFADRPRREIGHIPSRRFVELWETSANGFAVDPPNVSGPGCCDDSVSGRTFVFSGIRGWFMVV